MIDGILIRGPNRYKHKYEKTQGDKIPDVNTLNLPQALIPSFWGG